MQSGIALLEDRADPGNGATRADSGDDDIDIAAGIVPDFLCRGFPVDRRIGRVGRIAAGSLRQGGRIAQFLRPAQGAAHPERTRGEFELRAKEAEHLAPFQ